MDLLHPEIKYILLKICQKDKEAGQSMLHALMLVNRQWCDCAIRYLYKDPWLFIVGTSRFKAQKLIDTYLKCLQTVHESNSDDDAGSTNGHKVIQYNYFWLTKVLHIPALYECVSKWFEAQNKLSPKEEIDAKFFQLLDTFIDESPLQECTFADSSDSHRYRPPVNRSHLEKLANRSYLEKISKGPFELSYLNLGYYDCDDVDLQTITGKITDLKTFKVKAAKCSDGALAAFLLPQRKLTKLKIRKGNHIHQTIEALGARYLPRTLVKLRILSCDLESCENPLDSIAACTELRSLYMCHTTFPRNINPSYFLMPIARNCRFHNIDFTFTKLPGDVLEEIAKNSSTTLRKVIAKRFPDAETEDDEDEEEEEDQNYRDNCIAGIYALANHATNLTTFERDILLCEKRAVVYMLDAIGSSLTRLVIGSPALASRDSSNLIEAIAQNCGSLNDLDISFFMFSQESFEQLVHECKHIESLDIQSSQSIDDSSLDMMQREWQANGNLKYLDIADCPNVSEDAIVSLDLWIEDVLVALPEGR